jgi:hypothetical protein
MPPLWVPMDYGELIKDASVVIQHRKVGRGEISNVTFSILLDVLIQK